MSYDANNNRIEYIRTRQEELLESLREDIEYLEKEGNVKLNFSLKQLELLVNSKSYLNSNYNKLKHELSDKTFLERITPLINKISESNGSNFFEKFNINIGIIADEFLFNSFKDIANFYYINRSNYKNTDIDVFIIASAWRGLDNDWRGLGNPQNVELRHELENIISFYRSKGVKIVFYSKEDPTNYDNFVDIAKKCDYIFTTAIEKVEDYKKECNNEKVYVLEFGVNPIYNNPIGLNSPEKIKNGAIFAGSWYEKYSNRKKDTRKIFDGVINANGKLKVIDRNFNKNLINHRFPVEYLEYISPSIDHSTLQKVFKLYQWAINLNSIQNSQTMFANRIYELLAMGNLILSNYSIGINNQFPNIFTIQNSDEIKYIMNNYSEKDLYTLQMYGIRKVLRHHTTFHRVSYLLNKIGYDNFVIRNKKVAVVVDDISNKNHLENFNRQTYKDAELITIDDLIKKYESFDYITFFHSNYEYGEYYLEDLVNGFKYTNSSYITKDAYYDGDKYIDGVEHDYIDYIRDKYRTLFRRDLFELPDLIKIDKETACENGYSIDSLEINVNPINKHTNELDLKLSVIIPVYNNGDHLYGKCFQSLLRSSMFEHMDIILVDDGSTDEATINMIDRLNRLYPNVQVYKFNDGGSGSASRPRNMGVQLAKTNYITYLDPDNEAINDGYFHLFSEMENDKDLDLVVGNIIKIDDKETRLNYSYFVKKYYPSGIVEDTHELLKKTDLKAQSIQALIVKKDIILKNNLKMVENAVGQDTLFFQELLLKCSKIKVIDLDIHIYYAAVSTSVTNTISKEFFEKYVTLSERRYEFLKENHLLDHYLKNRFASYFVGWFLVRVPRIKEEDIEDSLKTLYKIYKIFDKGLKDLPEPLVEFKKYMKKGDYHGFYNYCKNYFKTT